MGDSWQGELDIILTQLRAALGDNLASCCLYGSTVRGNFIAGNSDLNLLLLLRDSTPAAHAAIAGVVDNNKSLDVFVLGVRGFARTVACFAPKFASIRRNYRVIHGADPFAGLPAEIGRQKFLCEQALRNFRLRMKYAYVTRSRHRRYDRYLSHCVTPLFCQLADVLRLDGVTVPADFAERIPVLERELGVSGAMFRELLEFKRTPHRLTDEAITEWHARLFIVVEAATRRVEARWAPPA